MHTVKFAVARVIANDEKVRALGITQASAATAVCGTPPAQSHHRH